MALTRYLLASRPASKPASGIPPSIVVTQPPLTQAWLFVQTFPHVPQLFRSEEVFVQTPSHAVA
jgi:hypothetical protein